MVKEFVEAYSQFSAADSYVLGFCYKHSVYEFICDELDSQYMKIDHASSKRGGYATLRMRLTTNLKESLIKAGARCVGSDSLIKDSKYNKGETFERLFTEENGVKWEKDSLPFWKGGDVEVNGIKYQIKFDGATIATEKNLRKAAAECGC
ncbi:MAG: hypothetical protein LUC37_02780 [Prevotella sp.]|nr:hypothetical protein [Prevotella sp.]